MSFAVARAIRGVQRQGRAYVGLWMVPPYPIRTLHSGVWVLPLPPMQVTRTQQISPADPLRDPPGSLHFGPHANDVGNNRER